MNRYALFAGVFGIALLAACGGGGSTGNSSPVQSLPQALTVRPDSSSVIGDTSTPIPIYVGFNHAALKKSMYGPVAFYSLTTGATEVITVNSGAMVQFVNDDTQRHTASGLGKSGFPAQFDNKSNTKAVGTVINGNLTWASGSLNPGASSKPFKIGPKGTYYFGCYYHYHVTPNMRDVVVSQ